MNLINNISLIAIDRMELVADEKSGSGLGVLYEEEN
jgi:hypothetical protein